MKLILLLSLVLLSATITEAKRKKSGKPKKPTKPEKPVKNAFSKFEKYTLKNTGK